VDQEAPGPVPLFLPVFAMESVAPSNRCADASLTLSDFQFDLPPELIAQVPAAQPDQARLLVLNRRAGALTHAHVDALPEHLQAGDLLVVNDTRVIPARIFGRAASGGGVELLLIRPCSDRQEPSFPLTLSHGVFTAAGRPKTMKIGKPAEHRVPPPYQGRGQGEVDSVQDEPHRSTSPSPSLVRRGIFEGGERELLWLCLGKPARRLRTGAEITFPGNVHATVAAVHGDGRCTIAFPDGSDVRGVLEKHGEIPLPPYIRRPDGPLPLDSVRYQTIFASVPGAIAAPTAGLHFTADLVAALAARGVALARLTLHVGPGTFLPVRSENVHLHVMEPEWCEIPAETAAAIQQVRRRGGRVIAVGTTTTRGLESAASDDRTVEPGKRWANCFIVPGHQFRVIDALFTNFHLPGSTLLLLASAFAGREAVLAAYAEAVRRRYRFYSYGDAMLIQ
jgi:S-adenosylmethionine:tRNA ribosyltransferase-isomerase